MKIPGIEERVIYRGRLEGARVLHWIFDNSRRSVVALPSIKLDEFRTKREVCWRIFIIHEEDSVTEKRIGWNGKVIKWRVIK